MPRLVHRLPASQGEQFIVHSLRKKSINRSPRFAREAGEPLTVNKRQRRLGFTLIEVLIVIFIMTILAAILLIASVSLTQRHASNLQGIAAKIASKEIEKLRNTDFATLPSSGSFTDPDLPKLPSGAAVRTIANYQSSTQIKQATITVTWQVNGANRQVFMDTLIYQNGI